MNENQNANMSRKEYNKLQAKQIGNSLSVFDGKEFLLRLANVELPSGSTTIWECPEGYIFKDENGNVINATKIVLEKKKKEYPKTYEECCDVLGYNHLKNYVAGYKPNLLCAFQELLICRDSYWKIAGEEMGLGKSWEPNSLQRVFSIGRIGGILLGKVLRHTGNTSVLEFPTEEMRDAFYENFKELIENCKELL